MKITIKSNGKITSAQIDEIKRKNENVGIKAHKIDGEIHSIEFDFTPPDLWSDLEIWLSDSETEKVIDYAKMNLSKRNKMQFTK